MPSRAPITILRSISRATSTARRSWCVMIGVIDRVNPETSDNFQDIDVKLSTPFASLSYVYIVGNLYKEEQRALEDSLSNDR